MPKALATFNGKRVLLTGDTGFKGSWLALWLLELGADVVGYALPPEAHQRLFSDLKLDQKIHHIDGDVRDLAYLSQVTNDFKPEFVFHLAAQPLVRTSYESPVLTFDTNVMGTVNLLEVMRLNPEIKVLINVTSDKCYKNHEWLWGYRENDELGGHDPYSASKAAAELVFSSYKDSFFSAEPRGLASVRAGNVIGGGDWAIDRVIPDTIRALQVGESVQIRNPRAVRPWQHVLEPLSGYLLLAAKLWQEPLKYQGSWNFGPSTDSIKTVAALTDACIAKWGGGSVSLNEEKKQPHEAGLLTLNCDKALQLLSWRPQWSFTQTIDETVDWYKLTAEQTSPLEISCRQLNKYMDGIDYD